MEPRGKCEHLGKEKQEWKDLQLSPFLQKVEMRVVTERLPVTTSFMAKVGTS
jgi:hypothetical protein